MINFQEERPKAKKGRNVWSLFELSSEVSVGGTEQFVLADFFHGGEKDGMKISSVGPNFHEKNLEKTEKNIKPATLSILQLKKRSLDIFISREFASVSKIAFFYLSEILRRQGSGEEGPLSLDHPNLIFKKDGIVIANWRSCSGGWFIGENSFEDKIIRRPGTRVIVLQKNLPTLVS